MSKVCSKCKLNLSLNSFTFNNKTKKYTYRCKNCLLQDQRLYREKNKEKLKVRDSNYYQKNKVQINERNKNYISDNRNKRNEYIRKYKKEKKLKEPSFKIYELLRKRIWRCVKKNKKSNISKYYLGCDLEFYKKWIEYTFSNDMNWENHGKIWHIDHVIPISYFNLTDDDKIKIAFNWKNTRALSIKDNLVKKDKIYFDDIFKHDKLLKSFINEMGDPQPSILEIR